MDTDFTDGGEEGQMGEGETILAFPADDGEKSIGARLPSLLLFSFPHPCTSVFIRGKKKLLLTASILVALAGR